MKGWEPGVRQEGPAVLVTTPDITELLGDTEAWKTAVERLGVTVPDGWAVRLVEMRHDEAAWTRDDVNQGAAVTRPVWRYRFRVEPAAPSAADIEELIALTSSAVAGAALSPNDEADKAFVVAIGDTQFGKALKSDTPILTTDGWVKHGDLRVGMQVFGRDGLPKRVLDVLPTTTGRLFEVELRDGTILTCSEQHQWSGYRKMHTADKKGWEKRPMVVSLPELAAITNQAAAKSRPFVLDASEPIEMPERDLLVDPYLFGVWLGDGNSRTGIISLGVEDREAVEHFGHEVPSNSRGGAMFSVRVPGLTASLRRLGVLGGKRVPEEYLMASQVQRLALVQGLMDTDGHAADAGACEFTNTNRQIIDSMLFLLRSLGMRPRVTEHVGRLDGVEHKTYWRVCFRATLPVFRLERKLRRTRVSTDRIDMRRSVVAVREVEPGDAQCITVEGGLYLAGEQLTVTHNCDGDGIEGTIKRVLASTERAAERLVELQDGGHMPETVYICWLGDCIEGFVSQGGGNAWRTPTTLTEQVRVARRLMLHMVDTFRELAPRVVLLSIPGNHDETVRFGKQTTRYDDSWAIEAAVSVSDAMAGQPAYANCSVKVPGRDELTLTVDMAGTIVGLAHGHQMKPGKANEWWAWQAHGLQPIGEATLLLTAHLHHLVVEQGGAKCHIQVPAMEHSSVWWRHLKGQVAPAGMVTMLVGAGLGHGGSGWDDIKVV